MARVGFLGLGLMGASMAANLIRAGHDVTVWNRSLAAAEPLLSDGATVVERPSDVGRRCDYVATCLPNGAIVSDVLFGPDGAMERAAPGTVVIDHSTISPGDARALASRCGDAGFEFLDAPISGGPEGAAAGTLAVFVGGSDRAFDRARAVIEAYAGAIVHIGPSGTGQVAKLANQIVIAATILGISEAFEYAAARGVPDDRLLEVLSGATADSKMLQTRVPVPGLQPGMPASNEWRPGFMTDFMAKDLDFALDDAAAARIGLRSTEIVRGLLRLAQADGKGKSDWTVLSQYL